MTQAGRCKSNFQENAQSEAHFVRTENRLAKQAGGESGIRTRDTVSRIHTFQACAFNHSATSPARNATV